MDRKVKHFYGNGLPDIEEKVNKWASIANATIDHKRMNRNHSPNPDGTI